VCVVPRKLALPLLTAVSLQGLLQCSSNTLPHPACDLDAPSKITLKEGFRGDLFSVNRNQVLIRLHGSSKALVIRNLTSPIC